MAVYFIQEGFSGPVKVGYSESADGVKRRMGEFQVGNSAPLRLLRVLEGGPEREQRLHATFRRAGLHLRGEWFRCRGLVQEVAFSLVEEPPGEWAAVCAEMAGIV